MVEFDRIKLLILDCDGVLTDGMICYDNNRIETKNFSAKDGLGIKLLSLTDIKVAVITGRESEILKQRCEDLGIEMLYQKVRNKVAVAEDILDKLKLKWVNVAYMGDDWNDYPVMQKVALAATPSDAFPSIKNLVDYVALRRGGDGAVREFIEYILQEKGIYEKTINTFIEYLKNR